MTKTALWTIVLIIVLAAIGAFFYLTRAPSAPSEDINTADASFSTATTSSASGDVYRISQASSTVSFTIGEVLHGSPFTPVGTTDQIAGDITVSSTSVTIGDLAIDARTFKTDNSHRDGEIDRNILKAEDPANEFMTFAPTSITGLPSTISPGNALNFDVLGDLTISGVTKPETFQVTMSVGTDTVSGTASTTLKRSDFNLVIPNIPFVADVTDQFTVTADIVANKATE